MRLTTVLLGLAGLSAAAKLHPRKGHKGLPNLGTTSKNSLFLTLRQSCDSGETECDDLYCIPTDGECCADGFGNYCPDGQYCVYGGCCDDGEICSSDDDTYDDDDYDLTDCDDGEESCGYLCMPSGSKCCDSDIGQYCDADETCGDFLCEDGDSSTSDDDSVTLCRRKGRGGGGGGGGSSGGGGDDDECGAGMVGVPAVLIGLAAVLPLVL